MGLPGRSYLLAVLLLTTVPTVAWGASQRPTAHIVQPGQTLAKIAKRYQLTIDELCEANDIRRNAKLKPGQRLQLPDEEDADSGAKDMNGRHQSAERSTATVGRGTGTTQKLGSTRGGSFSRYLKPPTKRGYVHVLGHHGEFKGQLVGKSGKLKPKAVVALSKVLAWPRSDFLMDKRLLLLLTKVSDAFGGRMLRVVSGYRTTSFSSESKHPLGRACDFHIPGVPNTALRDYVRSFNDVGVGYYPYSTFVHLDVREYDAYWVDYSGPGEAPRSHPLPVAKRELDSAESHPSEPARPAPPDALAAKPKEGSRNAVDEALEDANTGAPSAAPEAPREHSEGKSSGSTGDAESL